MKEDELKMAFEFFDVDGNGKITLENLKVSAALHPARFCR